MRVLRGRGEECERLDRLLAQVRGGASAVLVLRGEAGIGKTMLLEYVAERAAGSRLARAAGVQSEMELAFAALHQLCAPLLGGLESLPRPQRDALEVAFGLRDGEPPNRFLVAVASLGLLAEAAESRPLVCLIDDAQWLDRASAQVLAFVARRLLAEPIAMVFTVREPAGEELSDLPELAVAGLTDAEARALLASALPGRLDERVRDRILAESRGNPLALQELPRRVTAAELAGGFGLPDARPLASRIEQSFLARVHALPEDTQRLLLLAAADPLGDAALLRSAAPRLGIDAEAAHPAEAAGLLELGPRVEFVHPLARSAVYRGARARARREAHHALAEATDPALDPDRRAWHHAQAAAGADESVAAEMVGSAGRAQRRGGLAAAAAFLQRATELTPDPAVRGERALAAAQAKLDVADPVAAADLLAAAELAPLDALQRARRERLRAEVVFARRRGNDAAPLLLEAAGRLTALDPIAARDTYLEALAAAMFAGRLGTAPTAREVATAARAAPPAPDPPRAADLLLDALAVRLTDGYVAAAPALATALRACLERDDGRWVWLACRLAQDLWDDQLWHDLAVRGVRLGRESGALRALALASIYHAAFSVHSGQFPAAHAQIEDSMAITRVAGTAPLRYPEMMLVAWRGDLARWQATFGNWRGEVSERGEGMALAGIDWMLALLENALGRHGTALAAARFVCEHDDVGMCSWSLPELVEAAVREGRHDEAAAASEQLSARAGASGTAWALGVAAGARALVHGDEAAYREAIDRLTGTHAVLHVARARLLYGEWLRREQRVGEAREQLRAAYDAFARIGSEAFADRARRELEASGEAPRRLDADARDALTAQESQVARLAREGLTNPEIGAQLFISPRTVEYHLHKVFRKLDVSTRRELRAALAEAAQ